MYRLLISDKAKKELKKISVLHQKAILNALIEIKEEPYLLGKPLTRELTNYFSFRVGLYRIIYIIKEKDNIVYIITAGHRATIYTKVK